VYKQTKSKRATAKVLGIARNTVKSLLKQKEPPKYKRAVYVSKIDKHKEQIIEWRCEPYNFNGTKIFKELKKKGYIGSIGPIYRFLNKVDEDVGGHISKICNTTGTDGFPMDFKINIFVVYLYGF
jgi:transposase